MGNCIYYYHHEADVYPSKVMFLTGSFVEPLQEVANERKGYWGIEISRNREQVGVGDGERVRPVLFPEKWFVVAGDCCVFVADRWLCCVFSCVCVCGR